MEWGPLQFFKILIVRILFVNILVLFSIFFVDFRLTVSASLYMYIKAMLIVIINNDMSFGSSIKYVQAYGQTCSALKFRVL